MYDCIRNVVFAVIDSILENDCSSCKEIFYKTTKINKNIGAATIYRTLNVLEEIGAINRKNTYQFSCQTDLKSLVVVTMEDGQIYELSLAEWEEVLREGIQACGYGNGQRVISVMHKNCI